MSSHAPDFYHDTKNFRFHRNLIEGGDITIDPGDVVIYTDTSLEKRDLNTKANIALLIESPEYHRRYYDYIEENNHLFDRVLTFSKKLLDKGENYKFNAYGTTWLHESYRNIWDKTKLCSMIISNKTTTSGHRLRHQIASIISSQPDGPDIDMYGENYTKLQNIAPKVYDPDHSIVHITNCKILGLKDYMFSIVIENCKEDYYFSEKLIDCFLSGTIPIYYGCPSISRFFNENGILSFDTKEECIDIIQNITLEKYNKMLPYIKENYTIAQEYDIFKIDESHLLDFL
jgi:hypothetical protein